jgi:cellulose synthase/poly-beta-1,6-N-acetylglucosamine synthase-like glycosyltransferase
MLIFFYRFLKNRSIFINNESTPLPHSPFIIFQITTKACPPVVDRVVQDLRANCSSVDYSNYRIDIVGDECGNLPVPKEYSTPNHTRFKARALHYAVEWRRQRGENTDKTWVFHLDEESFVTKQCLGAILRYLDKPDPRPVAEGPIFYPNGMDTAGISRFADAVRPYICYNCVSELKSGLPSYIHGSNLLVRSDIEDAVGWDFGEYSAGEDGFFAGQIWRKFGKVFDWHGGVIEEQPPLTVKDWVRQHRRWFIGSMQNMRFLPRRKRIEVLSQLVSWGWSLPALVVNVLAFFFTQSIPLVASIFLWSMTFIWLQSFQNGMRFNTRGLGFARRLLFHLELFVAIPFINAIEALAATSGLLYRRNFQWVPTTK